MAARGRYYRYDGVLRLCGYAASVSAVGMKVQISTQLAVRQLPQDDAQISLLRRCRSISPPEKENRGHRCERSSGLQCEDTQRLSWCAGQPFDREERQDGHLSSHEELPEMGSSPLIGLAGRAVEGDATKYDHQGGE